MNILIYLDANQKPKIEVFQPSQAKKFGIGVQIRSIIEIFLTKVWSTLSNAPSADSGTGLTSKQSQKIPEPEVAACSSQDVKCIPSRDAGFLVMVYEYCHQRLDTLNEFCVVCDEPHIFQNGATMLKPTVCGRELCVFAFQTLGVMSEAAEDIATGPEVVDLLITMAKAAYKSERRDLIFDPFPTVVDPINPQSLALIPSHKDFSRCEKALGVLDMQKMSCYLGPELKKTVDAQDKLAYPLLQWLIGSNRSHIVRLPASAQLSFMNTPHQFLLMSSPPAKEATFRQYKKEHKSAFAFHGSPMENWHSIMRKGLINASGTKYQLHGAACGSGIYLSPQATMSYGYCCGQHRAYASETGSESSCGSRFLDVSGNLICLALCEVITSPDLKKSGIWVMPDADKVCTRFFFVYDKNTAPQHNVNTEAQMYRSKIQDAITFHQMN